MNQVAHSTLPSCDSMETFAENVLTLMDARGITMAKLSRESGLDRSTLHKSLKDGVGSFTLATCDKIAKVLETTTFELISKK